MYKTIFLDHDRYGEEIQDGNVKCLDNILNEWYENGWELVTITSSPSVIDSSYADFILVFKKRND